MFQNLEKCTAYILIDMEYLIRKINECYVFYGNLYPEKYFRKFDITTLLSCFVSTARIMYEGDPVNVIFYHKLGNTEIPYSEGPQDVMEYCNYLQPGRLINRHGATMNLYSFYADPEGEDMDYEEEFADHLREIANKDDCFTVIVCKDGEYIDILNYWIEEFDKHIEKKFFLFRDIDSSFGLDYPSDKFSYVTLDYAIGLCMGLQREEL